MSFVLAQSADAAAASARFQENSDIEEIRLVETRCRMAEDLPDPVGPLTIGLKTSSEARISSDQSAVFLVSFAIEGRYADQDESAAALLHITGRFALSYRLKPKYSPNEAELQAFKDVNAVFNGWPFFREFVQSMCSRMGLQIAPIPLLRLRLPGKQPARLARSHVAPSRKNLSHVREPSTIR